ncbi:superoxide dismutase family protein [Streptomyces albicerus]|uniref:superoxide dismutase family protein n=1 Tax=Streptomyces albicerus TaxID=2569859 RepID=UPI00124B2A9C|nr:superoxide dismutase family protein [Streptomyces albicerus]
MVAGTAGISGIVIGALASAVLVAGAGGAYGATGAGGAYGAGSAYGAPGDGGTGDTAGADETPGYRMRTEGRFAPPGSLIPSAAVTYDTKLVPAGSWIEVTQRGAAGGGMTVTLRVTGLKPGHVYGAHVHQKPCGADPADSGGHYQHRPSSDPADANADNEVWLDFTADAYGAGAASAYHDWNFRRGEAASVVLHSEPGNFGARLACFTVPFVGWAA